MHYKQIFLNTTTALCLFFATQANAVIIDTTYDLSNGLAGISMLDNGVVTIANNDHVELNVSFANNQALTIGDGGESFIGWLGVAGNTNTPYLINNATIEFLGFSGVGGASSLHNTGTKSDGKFHVGTEISDFLTAGQSVTFSGYRVTFDVVTVGNGLGIYDTLWFEAKGGNLAVSSVPEPSTLVLLLLGLAFVFFMQQRKKVR